MLRAATIADWTLARGRADETIGLASAESRLGGSSTGARRCLSLSLNPPPGLGVAVCLGVKVPLDLRRWEL